MYINSIVINKRRNRLIPLEVNTINTRSIRHIKLSLDAHYGWFFVAIFIKKKYGHQKKYMVIKKKICSSK